MSDALWCPQCGNRQTEAAACRICGHEVQKPPTEDAQGCVHGTDQAAVRCRPCEMMKRIAKQAKGLMEARDVYLERLKAVDRKALDEAQEVLAERTKMLQEEIRAADEANAWELA